MEMTEKKPDRPNGGHGPVFTFFVDGKEFHVDEPKITAGEIMDLARIPRETGLVQIFEDGSQKQLSPTRWLNSSRRSTSRKLRDSRGVEPCENDDRRKFSSSRRLTPSLKSDRILIGLP